jgi:oligosaccharyltransferase complex subunit alpha (ribophorin I)
MLSIYKKLRNEQVMLQVSHWGRIYVTESYNVKHAGAVFKGEFSRWNITEAQYYEGRNLNPHIYSLSTFLHPLAEYISLKDDLGNILSVSESKQVGLKRVKFSPRYPLLGGWQTRFVLGYSLPLQASVTTSSQGQKEVSFSQAPLLEEVRLSLV